MSAEKLSRLVAEAAAREGDPIPGDMEHLATERLDGSTRRAYLINGAFVWWGDQDPTPVPAHARAVYVRKV